MSQAVKHFSESIINVYEEQFVAQADLVYRFAFALTLSLDGGWVLVEKTFMEISRELERFQNASEGKVRTALITTCWKLFLEMKDKKFREGPSAVTQLLKPLAIEARAALVAVDIVGMTSADAAHAFSWPEKDLRIYLATARKALMTSALDY